MEIRIGKTAGFCYGVRRAVDGAEEELANTKSKVFCLGEIVHNKQVIQKLEEKGLIIVDRWQDAKEKIMIRAHGIPKNIEEEMKQAGIPIKDFTCPKVLAIHKMAEKYSQKGYYVFLLGKKEHPENKGTASYCGNEYSIIEDEAEVEKAIQEFQNAQNQKLIVISQTTFSIRKFEIIKEMIKHKIDKQVEVVFKNTICYATEERQKETVQLAKKVNKMIIVGGKNSSNTKKLYEIAKQTNPETIWIETEKELDTNWIKSEKIGIMAGASTPQSSIEEVVEVLRKIAR